MKDHYVLGTYRYADGSSHTLYKYAKKSKQAAHEHVLKNNETGKEQKIIGGPSKDVHNHLVTHGYVAEEAVPVNAAGAGGIAGIGTGPYPQSEPGVPKKKPLRVILNKAKMLTRTK